ncbi:MAG TPA: 3-oxoacyl-ACP synthase, partial [Acidimicrobiia bacterium]|nr:3-oxoacyl-ACP synthase [Acidimicrobiia bacterium]
MGSAPKPPPSICGLGTVTGFGWGNKHLWDGLVTSEPAAVLHPGFAEQFGRDEIWLATIPDEESPSDGPSKFSRSLHAAAREAIEDAHGRGWRPGGTVGVIHAFVLSEVQLWRDFYVER